MFRIKWWVVLVPEVFWVLFEPMEVGGLLTRKPCYSISPKTSGGFHECLGSFFYQERLYDGCSSINGIWQCSIANDDGFVAREMANCSQQCIDGLNTPCSTTQTIGENGVQLQGSTCLFPFHYHGRNYYSCTTAGHSEFWCTTQEDESSSSNGDWSWGPCGPQCNVAKEYSCRTKEDKVCQFPFVYQDKTYNECTHVGHDNPWCPIVVDEYGHATEHWGNCREECPVSNETDTNANLEMKHEISTTSDPPMSMTNQGNGWIVGFAIVVVLLVTSIVGNILLGLKVRDQGSFHRDWVQFSKKIEERPNILEENDDII